MSDRQHDANSPVRAVFFDLVGTLIAVRGGVGAQYAGIAAEFGVRTPPAAIDRAFPRAFRAAGPLAFRHAGPARVAAMEKQFWREVVRRIFLDVGALEQFGNRFDPFFDRLFDYFATADGWIVFPDVLPVLGRLKQSGLSIGLITNFDNRAFRLMESLGLARFFDSITIPAVAGAAKPERAIFEFALRRHDLTPEKAVQVGDSVEDDVEGAQAAGLRAVLMDRPGARGRSAAAPGSVTNAATTAPVIASLDELLLLPALRR